MRALLCLALLAAPVFAGAPPSAGATELTGTWVFEKEVNTRADGSVADVPSADYDGLVIYTPDGFMSATIMPRARGTDWLHEGATTAYAGRYEVDTSAHTVTHIPTTSIDPAEVGRRLVRRYAFEDGKLLLSGTWEHRGEKLTFTVYWKRAP